MLSASSNHDQRALRIAEREIKQPIAALNKKGLVWSLLGISKSDLSAWEPLSFPKNSLSRFRGSRHIAAAAFFYLYHMFAPKYEIQMRDTYRTQNQSKLPWVVITCFSYLVSWKIKLVSCEGRKANDCIFSIPCGLQWHFS